MKKASVKKPLRSVTKKIESGQLKRALARRAHARKTAELFDLAVPHVHRLDASLTENRHTPLIHLGQHPLSPFVINLRRSVPTPTEILQEGAQIHLNFLTHAALYPTELPVEPKDSLILSQTDLACQLQEDQFSLVSSPSQAKACGYRSTFPSSESITPLLHHSTTFLPSPLHISIPKDAFIPKTVPENIFAYFDLPEQETTKQEQEEEPEESELVELEGLHFQQQPVQTKTAWSWKLPTPQPWFRAVGAFVLISFVFVLPLHAMNLLSQLQDTKGTVDENSRDALSFLRTGTSATLAREATSAHSAFTRAQERFAHAQNTLSELGIGTSLILSSLPQTKNEFKTGRALLQAGQDISMAGGRITQALKAIETEVNPTPVSHIQLLQTYLQSLLPYVKNAHTQIASIQKESVPTAQQETFLQLSQQLPTLIASLEEFETLSNLAVTILGAQETKRYLLIFQNNTEIRPTGGFMGSFAEIKVRNGILEQLSIPTGGTYDLQGALKVTRIAPEPLQLLKAKWEFQDANWFPDFPTSARQLLQFYEDAGGPSVDGVIAVNATFVAELIGLLGPIEMADYGRTITQENFLFETQKIVELEYDRALNKPKAFIGDLAPKLIERALGGDGQLFLSLVDQLGTGLAQKEIQLFFTDDELQRAALTHGWAGAIVPATKDYLMVVDTNLGGGKTDGIIEEQIHLDVTIAEDGQIENTVTISRTHHGIEGALFTGVNNVDYVRLYVPKGSELVRASGFSIPDERLFENPEEEWIVDDDIEYQAATFTRQEESGTDVYEEQGKTVFGNWIQTAPSETSKVTFTYRLPFTLTEEKTGWAQSMKKLMGVSETQDYTLVVQKQSGVIDRQTTVSVSLPDSLKTLWKSYAGDDVKIANTTDGFIGLLLQPSL